MRCTAQRFCAFRRRLGFPGTVTSYPLAKFLALVANPPLPVAAHRAAYRKQPTDPALMWLALTGPLASGAAAAQAVDTGDSNPPLRLARH